MHGVGKSFSKQLSNLATVIGTQGMSQLVGSFDGDPKKFRQWI